MLTTLPKRSETPFKKRRQRSSRASIVSPPFKVRLFDYDRWDLLYIPTGTYNGNLIVAPSCHHTETFFSLLLRRSTHAWPTNVLHGFDKAVSICARHFVSIDVFHGRCDSLLFVLTQAMSVEKSIDGDTTIPHKQMIVFVFHFCSSLPSLR